MKSLFILSPLLIFCCMSCSSLPRLSESQREKQASEYKQNLEDNNVQVALLEVLSTGTIGLTIRPDNGDLSPLQSLPIIWLSLAAEDVSSLTPLLSLNLKDLTLMDYAGADLSVLEPLQLEKLNLSRCYNLDFSSLKYLSSLRELRVMPVPKTQSFSVIRSMCHIRRINFESSKIFWAEWEKTMEDAEPNVSH